MAKKEWFTWTVEFQVSRTWVEDGFDLTDERALDMLSEDLSYANIERELKAKVLSAPDPHEVAQAMGYKDADDRKRKEAGDWSDKTA